MFNSFQSNHHLIAERFEFVKIATYYYNKFSKDFDKIPTGLAVSDLLVQQMKTPQEVDGYPTIFVVNPTTNATVMIQTAGLEENDETQGIYGHNEAKVISALEQAADAVGYVQIHE